MKHAVFVRKPPSLREGDREAVVGVVGCWRQTKMRLFLSTPAKMMDDEMS